MNKIPHFKAVLSLEQGSRGIEWELTYSGESYPVLTFGHEAALKIFSNRTMAFNKIDFFFEKLEWAVLDVTLV